MYLFNPAKKLFDRLRSGGYTIATAESLTGGMIGSALTKIPGSSAVYWGGVVSYSVEAKEKILEVDPNIIRSCGVVSRETAEAMAFGVLSKSTADMSIAVTGVAGPGGGNAAVPVGTVWLALARKQNGSDPFVISQCLHLHGSRHHVRVETVRSAFKLVLDHLDRE